MAKIIVAAAALALVVSAMPLAGSQAAASAEPMRFGMHANAVPDQIAAGQRPDYGTFWVGPWTLKHGWGGPDQQMRDMVKAGVTPAIHFYYWGDDISPSCVENGCWSDLHGAWKDKAGWQRLANELVDRLKAVMGGKPVLIFLETEFNKGGISTYEPFDGYLAEKARFLKQGYPAAQTVMALGNWNQAAWGTFDRTAAASDYTGIQGMRGSTRDPLSSYKQLYESTLAGARKLQELFGKPVVIQDLALSTYPEPEYLEHQRTELKEFFDNLGTLKEAGVKALLYRTWRDNPNMDLKNYYGYAERHWGVAYPDGARKPSARVWLDGVAAERANPAGGSGPAALPVGAGLLREAEHFTTKTAGAAFSDALASGNAAWNLWANGHLAESLDFGSGGQFDLSIHARGTTLSGVGPRMVVSLAGQTILSADPGTSWGEHRIRAAAAGVVELRIAFTNDARSSTEDRNLLLDRVTIAPVPQNRAPEASFVSSAEHLRLSVDATGSSDPDGDPLTYAWSFGDGATSTGARAIHEYARAGSYVVRLTVSDGKAQSAAERTVAVEAPPLSASFRLSPNVNEWWVEVFVDASAPLSGVQARVADGPWSPLSLRSWGAWAASLRVPPGSEVVFRAQTDAGAEAVSQPFPWPQPNRAPTASFAVSASGLALAVDASASSDPDGDPLTYAWSFGDGATATGVRASHTYAASGTYAVRLTVSDGKASATVERNVSVKPPFAASFRISPNVNEWWVEVFVDANEAVRGVEVRVNDGPWAALSLRSWGAWAASLHVPQGSTVTFRATSQGGEFAVSAPAQWLGPAKLDATFEPKTQKNKWWIEVVVKAPERVGSVEYRANGGAWIAMDATKWGSWAKRADAGLPAGTRIEFRATGVSGAVAVSAPFAWG
ncbi:MAG TPA: PKD domain-containing protein [Candidatus Thermoplasmatota archaeon]|nr:PKD domain-containing protein [Candidatus Thermoplasmatota archaeon]